MSEPTQHDRQGIHGMPLLDPRPRPKHVGNFVRDELLGPFLVCIVLTAQTIIGLHSYANADQAPLLVYALPMLAAYMFFASRLARGWPRLRVLLYERRQSAMLATALDQAATGDSHAYHAVTGAGFDIDHVLICPAGVFAISVELPEHPAGHEPSALFDGEFLEISGAIPIREPIARARVVARMFGKLLFERLGRAQRVIPVLLMPGWSVEQPSYPRLETCAASPADFLAFVSRLKPALDRDELVELRGAMAGIVRDGLIRSGHLKHIGLSAH
jgi:hypothetical protein